MSVPVKVRKPQGVLLYRGPSLLNGMPIIAVATNVAGRSRNPKTGPVIQTYILTNHGDDPTTAAKTRSDESICGDCPHRGVSGSGKLGSCYVNVIFGPRQVYRSFKGDLYPRFNRRSHLRYFENRVLRLGAYGDPAAVPLSIWEALCGVATNWTGYTHQWRTCDPNYARLIMASVETELQASQAKELGYRTFRVRTPGQPLLEDEFVCPASNEAGNRLTCERCRACSGAKASSRAVNPVIIVHGSSVGWKQKLYGQTIERIHEEERKSLFSLALVN